MGAREDYLVRERAEKYCRSRGGSERNFLGGV